MDEVQRAVILYLDQPGQVSDVAVNVRRIVAPDANGNISIYLSVTVTVRCLLVRWGRQSRLPTDGFTRDNGVDL